MFFKNQKVVCIDDTFGSLKQFYTALPEKDKVYVVRGMAPAVSITAGVKQDDLAVYLVGLHNPCSSTPPHRERGFRCERFRPLDEAPVEETFTEAKPAYVPIMIQ
jgi:hypothetical protein